MVKFIFVLALSFLPERLRRRSAIWQGAAAVLALAAFMQGVCYAAIHYPFQGLPREYDQALEWLQRNTQKDAVVLFFLGGNFFVKSLFAGVGGQAAALYIKIVSLVFQLHAFLDGIHLGRNGPGIFFHGLRRLSEYGFQVAAAIELNFHIRPTLFNADTFINFFKDLAVDILKRFG